MSLFGWITGNSKSAEKAVNGVVDGIDAMFFTEEEKSQANMKALELKIEFARATAGMSISRRIIVIVVSAMWVLACVLLMALGLWMGKEWMRQRPTTNITISISISTLIHNPRPPAPLNLLL
jgi:hypothetical protein